VFRNRNDDAVSQIGTNTTFVFRLFLPNW
jgi:hypothetical protein